jgi:hypothetical protein
MQQETNADWVKHIQNWRRSGLSQSAYCQAHKINRSTFAGHLSRQQKLEFDRPSAAVVPVIIEPALNKHTRTPTPQKNSDIQIQHSSGWQLSVPHSIDINWLSQLLRALT